jgi:hypothetical protein
MLRRLFFLLPDEASGASLVTDLEAAGVTREHLHAVTGAGRRIEGLPPATPRQQRDSVWRLEHWLWNGNLVLFAVAALGLLYSLYLGYVVVAILAAAVMIASITAGALFVYRVPDTHLGELRSALAHGEIVVMVDVPRHQVDGIQRLVEQRHPEAEVSGVGWTIERLGI